MHGSESLVLRSAFVALVQWGRVVTESERRINVLELDTYTSEWHRDGKG